MRTRRTRTPRSDLHELIRSLSGSEKRFFKLSAARQAGEKKYLALFDAVAAQTEYNEEAIREQFHGESFVRHLSAAKNHLYGLVMKSLRDFHTSRSRRIADLQHDASLLINRGLHSHAWRSLNKGLKLAEESGHFTAAVEIAVEQWSMMMDHAESIGEFEEKGNAALGKAMRHLESRRILLHLVELNSRLSIYRAEEADGEKSPDDIRQFYRTMLQHPLLADEARYKEARVAAYYHLVRGSCFQYLGDFERAWQEKRTVLEVSEQILRIETDSIKNYLSAAQNCANAALGLGHKNELEELVSRMRALLRDLQLSEKDQALLFSKVATIELQRLLMNTSARRKGIPGWIAETLEEHGKHIRKSTMFQIYFMAGTVLSLGRRYHDVLEWSRAGLDIAPLDSYAERRLDLLLMRTIALHELGEIPLLDSQLRSLKRRNSNEQWFPYQKACYQVLTALQNESAPGRKKRTARDIVASHNISIAPDGERNPLLFWLSGIM